MNNNQIELYNEMSQNFIEYAVAVNSGKYCKVSQVI